MNNANYINSINDYIPHLMELRKRLLRSALVLSSLFLVLFYFDEILYNFVARPLLENLPSGGQLIAIDITTPFTVPMKLALIVASFVAAPYCLFQAWAFVKPGLYRHEKKTIFPFLITSIILFYLGITFSFLVLCPMAIQFFVKSTPANVTLMTDIRYYLDFVLTLLFAGGIAFQVPVITVALIRAGIVTTLLLTHLRPYIIVAAFIAGMLLTPPDVLSQVLVALPMWGLFELGLLFGKHLELEKNKQKELNKN